jgi:hypothetical protein
MGDDPTAGNPDWILTGFRPPRGHLSGGADKPRADRRAVRAVALALVSDAATNRASAANAEPTCGLPVPAQQRRGSHDSRPQELARQHPCQRSEHEAILRLQPRTNHLPAQHRYLVSQHKQFDVLRRLATTAGGYEREQHPERRIHDREQHPNDHAEPSRYGPAEV